MSRCAACLLILIADRSGAGKDATAASVEQVTSTTPYVLAWPAMA